MKESKPNEDLNRIPSEASKILARTFIILMAMLLQTVLQIHVM